MLSKFVREKSSDFDEAIDRLLISMKADALDSEEYKGKLTSLERLSALRVEERTRRISPDTMALVASNILGILIIVGYERSNVLASKALGFLPRGRR